MAHGLIQFLEIAQHHPTEGDPQEAAIRAGDPVDDNKRPHAVLARDEGIGDHAGLDRILLQ